MTKYRAIVSIEFDQDDLNEIAKHVGMDSDRIRPMEMINGELDNISFGSPWLEQFFINGKPQITRLSDGLVIEVNNHD